MSAWTHTVADTCPWPERRGRRCRIVPPPDGLKVYPWAGRLPSERVVLVEDDPLSLTYSEWGVWSCVLTVSHLVPITDGAAS